jgi:hypothetical protein
MGLISGSASVTRFRLVSRPDEPDFDRAAFREIPPGSELRETAGFVPFEPGAEYRVGDSRWFFRLRVDRVRPDATAVRERVRQLVATEREATGADFIGPKKRRHLRALAEEELALRTSPRSAIVEGAIDGQAVWIGTTAKSRIGTVLQLLRRIEVVADYTAPWIERDEPEAESPLVEITEPGQSVAGCRFLRELIGDRDVMVEPEAGSVRLQTPEAKVALTGAVLNELHRYLERGAEPLVAKLVTGEASFRFDALAYRISGLGIETTRHGHWSELLDERLERIAAVFELLDRKYGELMPKAAESAAASG